MEIDILKNAPRDAAKLEQIIKKKEERRKEDITSLSILELHDLVSEIEILEFVLFLVDSNNKRKNDSNLDSTRDKCSIAS